MDTVYFKYVNRDTSIDNSSLTALGSKILQYHCDIEDPVITWLLDIAKRHN